MSEDIKIKYNTLGTQNSGSHGGVTLDNDNDGVKINYNSSNVDPLNRYYQGSTLNSGNATIDYNNFDINHSDDYYRGASLNGDGDVKIAGNTFTTNHSRDYYRGTSFHWSGTWMIGTHYISDIYNVDYVIHEGALLVCVKSHLSSLENEPINFIRDDNGSIIGVDSEYWDFVISGIAGFPGHSPGIKIVNNYWYICDNTSVPVEQQIWINTGVRAKMTLADLTPEEIAELQRPGMELINNFLRDVIVQQTGNNTEKVMSQDAVTRELNSKVDKEVGKGLSTNDYTTAEKTKLSNIEEGAQENVIEHIKIDNVEQEIVNKTVNLPAYPSTLAELAEDANHRVVTDAEKIAWNAKYVKPATGIPAEHLADGVIPDVSNFITNSVDNLVNYYTKSETFTQDEVRGLINSIQQFTYESVAELPTAEAATMHKIYLVPSTHSVSENVKDEFITINKGTELNPVYEWEQIGSTTVDLSDYVTDSELTSTLLGYVTNENFISALSGKQDKIDENHKLDYSLLDNTPVIPAAQVNSDWNASSGVAEILNKPIIPAGIYMGVCESASSTANKVVTTEVFPLTNSKPLVGTIIGVKFTNSNTASNATLNVNNTGNASIWYNDNIYTEGGRYAGISSRYVLYSWNGTQWVWLTDGFDENDNYLAYQVRNNNATLFVSDDTYRYRLLFTSADNTKLVPANTSTSINATDIKTVNTRKINPFGPIYYFNDTNSVLTGEYPDASTLYERINTVDLGYSFNMTGQALSLARRLPVYIKCTPQTDGSVIIDSTTPFVQALPSNNDGKVYIFLGIATSGTQVEMTVLHPVYSYQEGSMRMWMNSYQERSMTYAEIDTIWESVKINYIE